MLLHPAHTSCSLQHSACALHALHASCMMHLADSKQRKQAVNVSHLAVRSGRQRATHAGHIGARDSSKPVNLLNQAAGAASPGGSRAKTAPCAAATCDTTHEGGFGPLQALASTALCSFGHTYSLL